MPLYQEKIAEQFEEKKDALCSTSADDTDFIEKYARALRELKNNHGRKDVLEKVADIKYPGALPSKEYHERGKIVIPFKKSEEWTSHEVVNSWARAKMEDVTTVAVDGSQAKSTPEFNLPIGLVQAVCVTNDHTAKGSFDRDVNVEILTSESVSEEKSETGSGDIEKEELYTERFEQETDFVCEKIKEHAGERPPPVVFYDGSLLVWFLERLDPSKRERYGTAMGRLLATSEKYEVPVVGYISGSKATELKELLQHMQLVQESDPSLHDSQFVSRLMENWGDRTVLFNSQQSSSLKRLETEFEGEHYDFAHDIMFTYLKTGEGAQLDRVEMPRWILENDMLEHTMNMVRGECAVGRGYPEILQQADADAVISSKDRDEFLGMCQRFAEKHDIKMRWNQKAKSKKRRRRR